MRRDTGMTMIMQIKCVNMQINEPFSKSIIKQCFHLLCAPDPTVHTNAGRSFFIRASIAMVRLTVVSQSLICLIIDFTIHQLQVRVQEIN